MFYRSAIRSALKTHPPGVQNFEKEEDINDKNIACEIPLHKSHEQPA